MERLIDAGRRRDLHRPDRHPQGRADPARAVDLTWDHDRHRATPSRPVRPDSASSPDASGRPPTRPPRRPSPAVVRLGPVGLGLLVVQRRHHLVRLRPVRGPRSWSATPGPAGSPPTPGWASRPPWPGSLIALIAPVTGQRADAGGHRRRNLGDLDARWSSRSCWRCSWSRTSPATCGSRWSCWPPERSSRSSPASPTTRCCSRCRPRRRSVGCPASAGPWATSAASSLLLICFFGFIKPEVGLFGVTTEGGLDIRAVAVLSAVWLAVFAHSGPVRRARDPGRPRSTPGVVLRVVPVAVHDVKSLYRTDRNAVWFLIASALYRDGLAAVFTFGAVLAVNGLRADPVRRAHLRHRRQRRGCRRRARHGPVRGPDRPQAGHHDLAGRPDRLLRRSCCSPTARRCSGSSG